MALMLSSHVVPSWVAGPSATRVGGAPFVDLLAREQMSKATVERQCFVCGVRHRRDSLLRPLKVTKGADGERFLMCRSERWVLPGTECPKDGGSDAADIWVCDAKASENRSRWALAKQKQEVAAKEAAANAAVQQGAAGAMGSRGQSSGASAGAGGASAINVANNDSIAAMAEAICDQASDRTVTPVDERAVVLLSHHRNAVSTALGSCAPRCVSVPLADRTVTLATQAGSSQLG